MKKVISLCVSVLLCFAVCTSAFAASPAAIVTVSQSEIWAKDTVTVTVGLNQSLEGVESFDWSLYFDETIFELQSVSLGNVQSDLMASGIKKDATGSYISIFFADRTAEGQGFSQGTVCTAVFRAKDGKGEKAGKFFVKNVGVYDRNYEPIAIEESAVKSVTVRRVEATGITVESNPKKMSYKYKEAFNPEGLTLKLSYNNGTSEIVKSGFTCTPKTFTVESGLPMFGIQGKTPVTISYKGFTTTLTVDVKLTPIQWLIKIMLFGWLWY